MADVTEGIFGKWCESRDVVKRI